MDRVGGQCSVKYLYSPEGLVPVARQLQLRVHVSQEPVEAVTLQRLPQPPPRRQIAAAALVVGRRPAKYKYRQKLKGVKIFGALGPEDGGVQGVEVVEPHGGHAPRVAAQLGRGHRVGLALLVHVPNLLRNDIE